MFNPSPYGAQCPANHHPPTYAHHTNTPLTKPTHTYRTKRQTQQQEHQQKPWRPHCNSMTTPILTDSTLSHCQLRCHEESRADSSHPQLRCDAACRTLHRLRRAKGEGRRIPAAACESVALKGTAQFEACLGTSQLHLLHAWGPCMGRPTVTASCNCHYSYPCGGSSAALNGCRRRRTARVRCRLNLL